MKELAEQAATGTYDSTQRLMIASKFQVMTSEINRIANATDFNRIKLIDGKFSIKSNINPTTIETSKQNLIETYDYCQKLKVGYDRDNPNSYYDFQ